MSDKLSHTQVQMHSRCEQQWVFRYVDGKKIPPAAAMVSGSAAHKGVEHDLSTKMRTGEAAPWDEIQDVTLAAVEREKVIWVPPDEKKGIVQIRKKVEEVAVVAAKTYHGNVTPKVQPAALEKYFEVSLPGLDIPMIGYMDVIEKDSTIRDTKVTQKTPDPRAAKDSMQLVVYDMAAREQGITPKQLILDHIVVQSKSRHVCQKRTVDAEDRYIALKRILSARARMLSGNVAPAPPGSWWCSPRWCGYWSICPWVKGKVSVGGGW